MTINITNLFKQYQTANSTVTAVNIPQLAIKEQSFTCIVGQSGCGKTTLLRLLAQLEAPSLGEIKFQQSIHQPKLGIVFQEPRLMPWLTVAENITFAAKHEETLDKEKLPQLLATLGLTAFTNAYPVQLSGGMAQRVSLGRTLFHNPSIILMDEPFSALDYFTRQGLQETLLKLFQQERKTIFFVTHDVEEALLLAERVLVMNHGEVVFDTPIPFSYPRRNTDHEFLLLRQKILQNIR